MQELTATGNLIEYELLQERASFAAVLARSELEAALHAQEPVGLWFELGRSGEAETTQLTLELTSTDVEEMLQSSPGDEVIVALDAGEVDRVFADVEAHGMRGALAIAVATAAIAAPTSLAASPQLSSQVSPQVSSQVAKTQVTRQIVRPAATAQVRAQVVKTQLHKSLVVKGAGVKLLGGLAR
jgi:hypothetical protein